MGLAVLTFEGQMSDAKETLVFEEEIKEL